MGALRLLPISGGIFAGPYADRMPELTAAALLKGLEGLDPQARAALAARTVDMCIFTEVDFPKFQGAFAKQK